MDEVESEVYVSVVVCVVCIAVVGVVTVLSVVADDMEDVLGLGDVVEFASSIFIYIRYMHEYICNYY